MPNTAINIALTSQAQAAAAQAQQAADEAHRERCKIELGKYTPQGATVSEMRSYSKCVDLLYPEPMTQSELLTAKACVLTILVCALIGAVLMHINDGYDWMSAFFGGIFGAFGGALMLAVVAGVAFLFY